MKNCSALDWLVKKVPVSSTVFIEEVQNNCVFQFGIMKLPYKMIRQIELFSNISITSTHKNFNYNGFRFSIINENSRKNGVNRYRVNIDNEPALLELLAA